MCEWRKRKAYYISIKVAKTYSLACKSLPSNFNTWANLILSPKRNGAEKNIKKRELRRNRSREQEAGGAKSALKQTWNMPQCFGHRNAGKCLSWGNRTRTAPQQFPFCPFSIRCIPWGAIKVWTSCLLPPFPAWLCSGPKHINKKSRSLHFSK